MSLSKVKKKVLIKDQQEQIKLSERIDQIVTSAPTERKEDQQHWQNFPVRNELL